MYWESLQHYDSLQNETHCLELFTIIRLAKESETDGTLHLVFNRNAKYAELGK